MWLFAANEFWNKQKKDNQVKEIKMRKLCYLNQNRMNWREIKKLNLDSLKIYLVLVTWKKKIIKPLPILNSTTQVTAQNLNVMLHREKIVLIEKSNTLVQVSKQFLAMRVWF